MKGFTLIELLVIFSVIGLLSAIAIPSYSAYSVRAKLTDGLTTLKSTGNSMQLDFNVTGSYACDKTSWSTKYFSYLCSASANSFTITATGLEDIANYSYSINASGEQKTLAHPLGSSDQCWRISKPC